MKNEDDSETLDAALERIEARVANATEDERRVIAARLRELADEVDTLAERLG